MKIGVYGGTFDPIHLAHLVVAEYATTELNLDLLYFVPSYIPPHKLSKTISSPMHRLNMLNLVVDENEKFTVSEFELQKGGTSFTIETLTYFRDRYNVPRHDLWLIIGADNLVDFHRWRSPETIKSLAHIAVAGRPNFDVAHLQTEFTFLNSPLLDISASMIRQRIRDGKTIRYLVPDKVEHYIVKHGLYHFWDSK